MMLPRQVPPPTDMNKDQVPPMPLEETVSHMVFCDAFNMGHAIDMTQA